MHLGMFSFVEGYPQYLGVSSAPQKVLIRMEAKQITNLITILMISFCSTDDISLQHPPPPFLSLLSGSIVPMEVFLDIQDGGILWFGGFEIDITQDYLKSDI